MQWSTGTAKGSNSDSTTAASWNKWRMFGEGENGGEEFGEVKVI